jgi:hypothetical protein
LCITADFVRQCSGSAVPVARGAGEKKRNAHRGAEVGLLDQRINRAITRTDRGNDLAPIFDRAARRVEDEPASVGLVTIDGGSDTTQQTAWSFDHLVGASK